MMAPFACVLHGDENNAAYSAPARGSTELEAYRNLMEILGIEFPKEK